MRGIYGHSQKCRRASMGQIEHRADQFRVRFRYVGAGVGRLQIARTAKGNVMGGRLLCGRTVGAKEPRRARDGLESEYVKDAVELRMRRNHGLIGYYRAANRA